MTVIYCDWINPREQNGTKLITKKLTNERRNKSQTLKSNVLDITQYFISHKLAARL